MVLYPMDWLGSAYVEDADRIHQNLIHIPIYVALRQSWDPPAHHYPFQRSLCSVWDKLVAPPCTPKGLSI
jgi:hypothetical protein